MIIVSYIAYVKKNPEQHQSSAFKLWGGKIIAYIVLSFFIFIFILLFFSKDTRVAILFHHYGLSSCSFIIRNTRIMLNL